MAIYFARHGLTDWNNEKRIQGSVDIELNEEGRVQAKKMHDELQDVNFSAIYSSPLKRALETAEIIASAHQDTPFILAPEMRERNFGSYEGKPMDLNSGLQTLWDYGVVPVVDDHEGILDLEARIYSFLDRIYEKHKDDDILVVSHGGTWLMFYQYHVGRPKSGSLFEFPRSTHGDFLIIDRDGHITDHTGSEGMPGTKIRTDLAI